MLQSLRIQNVALVESAEIEFGPQFNVLTGETGAGKSIILGSLNFILGEKLGKSMVRSGAASARVDAVFSADDALLVEISTACGIDSDDGVVILSRTMKSDGKGECRINGSVVTAAMLREIAGMLVHIHGQHDTEVLLKPRNHIDILDDFGAKEIRPLLTAYKHEYDEWRALEKRLKSLGGDESERARLVDLYQFQIREIELADLQMGEDEALAEKKVTMQNFEKISTNLAQGVAYLAGDDGGAVSLFKRALSALGSVSGFDERLGKIYDRAVEAGYALGEVEDELQGYLDDMEFDEEEFARVDKRLDEIKALRRKYGGSVDEVLRFLADARTKLDALLNSERDITEVQNAIQAKLRRLEACAAELSAARCAQSDKMRAKIVAELADLGMPSCTFAVDFRDVSPRADGTDDMEFMFSANAGEPLRPLATIISGGEMSRFMLALKSITYGVGEGGVHKVGTVVFDEIDTGIGGMMGHKLAEKMSTLSQNCQIICVTHLAQIAAVANNHFLIQKCEQGGRTATNVFPLDSDGRAAEIARMRG
ncbi:MAG: DNA repair protein RecN [Firmicutes bacterium]|nr:DNA repair protein RecN [Bacillota bacterium]